MPTQQDVLDTLTSLRSEITRKGLSDLKEVSVVAYHGIINQFDALIAAVNAIQPQPACPEFWITCSCLFHQQMRDAYAEAEREKELRLASLSD